MIPFAPEDIGILITIVLVEGILSVDNAIVLAALAGQLPEQQQSKALKYGMFGAFTFRILAVLLARELLQWNWVNFIGGTYLLYVGIAHFVKNQRSRDLPKPKANSFWRVILQIELTDIAFSIDSIVAAIGLSKKVWLIITGGILGIIMIRFLSALFVKLLKIRPQLEDSAFAIVILVGIKVVLEGFHLDAVRFHSTENPAFWLFWICLITCFLVGMLWKPTDTKALT